MALPKITIGTVVKLLIASMLVGMVLAFFNLTPGTIVEWVQTSLKDVASNFASYFQWALSYILLGAVIVVPIWLVSYIWRAANGRGDDRREPRDERYE